MQQKENGFESIFFLIDTLEAHKAEKQKLPMVGTKNILNQNYDKVTSEGYLAFSTGDFFHAMSV